MPIVSVIVPVYNVAPYLPRCVDSILTQDYHDFELILVDDGATDGSGAICDAYGEKDRRVRVVHQQNGGLSAARNTGIGAASGTYLTFIDADDYVASSYLRYLLTLMGSAEGCKVCQANHFVVRGVKAVPSAPETGVTVFTQTAACEAVLYHDRVDVSAWGKLYHRSVFDRLRFPAGKLYEDTFLFGHILLQTPVYVYGGQGQYYYVQREDSIVHRGFSPETLSYLDAVEELTATALQIDPALGMACDRRRVHARLSVLRYMDRCPQAYRTERDRLRREALALAPVVCALPRTPRRDRLALTLLRLGWMPFYRGWQLYNRFR